MATPVLDLTSLVNRPVVRVPLPSGEPGQFWLITPDIMPPIDQARLDILSARWIELAGKASNALTDEEKTELAALPNALCRLVLEAPDEVHAALDDRQRMLIVRTAESTFRTGQPMPSMAGLTAAMAALAPAADGPTGANSSPDSSASTEAIP